MQRSRIVRAVQADLIEHTSSRDQPLMQVGQRPDAPAGADVETLRPITPVTSEDAARDPWRIPRGETNDAKALQASVAAAA
jgi:hypothetical protein